MISSNLPENSLLQSDLYPSGSVESPLSVPIRFPPPVTVIFTLSRAFPDRIPFDLPRSLLQKQDPSRRHTADFLRMSVTDVLFLPESFCGLRTVSFPVHHIRLLQFTGLNGSFHTGRHFSRSRIRPVFWPRDPPFRNSSASAVGHDGNIDHLSGIPVPADPISIIFCSVQKLWKR